MIRFALAAFGGVCLFAQSAAVHNVYIFPMREGLDQYLAETLTRNHVMQVVANAKAADVILTDHLGDAFEHQLDEIHTPEKEDADKKAEAHPSFRSTNGTGNIFLVDAKSRQVLWSGFEKPSAGKPRREAERITKQLQGFGK